VTAAEAFVIRLGDDFAGPRAAAVKVWPVDRQGDRTCRIGIRGADVLLSPRPRETAHADLTAEQMRDLATALIERADAIDHGIPAQPQESRA